jgi:hypothetical protein
VESILIYIHDLQYRSNIPPPQHRWRENQGDTQLSVVQYRSIGRPSIIWGMIICHPSEIIY